MSFGKALQGIGMGMAGQGAQWAKIQQQEQLMQQQQQEQEQARQKEIVEQRRTAMAQDARIARMHLESGNMDAFNKLAQNRIQLIEQQGEDPSDTIGLMSMVSNGHVDDAINSLKSLETEAVVRGYLPEIKAKERKVLKTENGRVTFLNKDGSVSEEAIQGALSGGGEQLDFSDMRGVIGDIEKLTRDASDIKDAASALEKISKTGTSTDKLAAVFTFMKALDPSSVVRENEQDQVASSGSVASAFRGYVSSLSGDGAISPDVLENMVLTAKRLANQKIEGTASRAGRVIDAFGDRLSNKARGRLQNIVPGAFEMFDATKGVVNRAPATLTTLDEVGQGTNLPEKMTSNTLNWSELSE